VEPRPDRQAQSESEEDEPEGGQPRIGADAVASKSSEGARRIATTTMTTLIRSSRDHAMRPFFMEKAARIQ
jgi:hypothetical protein